MLELCQGLFQQGDSCCLVSMLADHNSVLNQSPAGLYSFSLSVRHAVWASSHFGTEFHANMSKHMHTFMLSFPHLLFRYSFTLAYKWKVLDPHTKTITSISHPEVSPLSALLNISLWTQHETLSNSERPLEWSNSLATYSSPPIPSGLTQAAAVSRNLASEMWRDHLHSVKSLRLVEIT